MSAEMNGARVPNASSESVEPHRNQPSASGPAVRLKTLVIGLGNPLVSDDSVGLRVARQLESLLADRTDIDVTEDYWGGLRLMERMIGYDRAIIVDAMCTGAPAGTLTILGPNDMNTQKSASAHDVNLPTALAFGRQAGAHLPPDDAIQLVGIEAHDILTFSEECTPSVAAAIPRATRLVMNLLEPTGANAL